MTPIRLGIVGLGRLGMEHARTLRFGVPGVRLAAVCSTVPDEVTRARSELDVPAGYVEYERMIAEAELDGVVIASSSAVHTDQIVGAIEAGLHVFCEKPLGTTIEQCRRAEAVVTAHPEQRFMLGFMRRYDSSYRYAVQRIRSGAIGEPFLVRAYGLDPDRFAAGAIRFAATSGGIFLDMMIHDIDLARWLLRSEVRMVHAIGGNFKHQAFGEVGDVDNATALMQFDDNAMGLFYAGRTAAHGYHVETEIVGTEGAIRIDGVPRSTRAVVYTGAGVGEPIVQSFPERFAEAFRNEFLEFAACIREARSPEVSVHDGVRATTVAHAATESLRARTAIDVQYR